MSNLELALNFLFAQSAQSLLAIFWYTIVFEMPRYGFAFIALTLASVTASREATLSARTTPNSAARPRVSVVVAGHSEAAALERCVRSIREQSLSIHEIVVVSDGSADHMPAVASRLIKEGFVNRAFSTELRGGKSSGLNLGIRLSTGDIIVNVDCDCSYDRFAFENVVRPFSDPTVGAVCGDIVPRNGDASLVARFQEIEYLFTLSVGKRIGAALDQVACASGAFGAFRREALVSVSGVDVGGGEDLDLTLRLRTAGWRIAFAQDGVCYTDVPVTLWQLIRQRFRWERDAVWLRFRKHWRLMVPGSSQFAPAEAFHQWDFLAFSVAAAIGFPFYLAWLFFTYGAFAVVILVGTQVGLFVIDAAMLAMAALVTKRAVFLRNIPYLCGYALFASYIMRSVRVWAFAEEWFLSGSRRDNYIPLKVRAVRKW
jgi:cellulose synthase/poly-beta-1,6-N-acetylglucosamine synthase-like glycosyltransferase